MKKVLCLVIGLCLFLGSIPVFAETLTEKHTVTYEFKNGKTYLTKYEGVEEEYVKSDFECEIENGEVVITKYIGNSEIVVIPEEINGLKVTKIGEEAFRNIDTLSRVVLPETMKEIGVMSFTDCGKLVEIDIKNVEKIHWYAFARCYNLKTVTHSGNVKMIGEEAFCDCHSLSDINLECVEGLGKGAFRNCIGLKSVSLLNLKSWYGIGEERVDINQRKIDKIKSYPNMIGQYAVDSLYTPFFECTALEEIRIKWPEKNDGKKFDALFLNCPNITKVTFENFTAMPSDAEFYNISYSTQPKAHLEMYATMNKRPDFTLYGYDERVKEYADEKGIRCEILGMGKTRVEPELQSIHGGIVLRSVFVDRITKIAESLGGTVIVAGNDVAVQKNGKQLVILGDIVYYMENGVMVTENLYKNASFIKMPERALEIVLGTDERKSEEYKEVFRTFNGSVYRLRGTIETPYGTVAETATGGVMHGYANALTFVKWNGETVAITNEAPRYNPWSWARWSKIELSEDGKILTVTYPENTERMAFSQSPDSPEIVLWDEGTYIITANLETGEVECVIKPLKEEKKEETTEKIEEEKTTENEFAVFEKDGIKVTTSILKEPQNGPANMFDDNFVSYCVITVRDETKPEYIQFDLGEVKNVEKLGLAFRFGATRTTYFDIRVSEDGINYETVVPKRGSDSNNEMQYFDIDKSARFIRMYGYSNSQNRYWISITEAEVIVK